MSVMDEIEQKFSGTWDWVSEKNIEALCDHMGKLFFVLFICCFVFLLFFILYKYINI